jgi:hypothetical protein
MFAHRRLVVLSTLAWALACDELPGFAVRGVRVVVETDAPFAQRPDFPARIESTLDAALRYWGGTWQDLDGMSIALTGDPYVSCGGNASALGCFDGNIRITTRDPGIGTFSCVEQTILVHEIGHAALGDSLHEDPRWMQLEPLEAALAGRTGYTAEGEVECVIWPSVWRHPLGMP